MEMKPLRKWMGDWLDEHWAPRRVAVLEGQKRALEKMVDHLAVTSTQLKGALQKSEARREQEIAGLRALLCEQGYHAVPGLTPAQIERLAMLVEECGEVIQAAGKVLRHGWTSSSPLGGKPNRIQLERELGDLRAVVNLCADAGDVSQPKIGSWAAAKQNAIPRWTHHQTLALVRDQAAAIAAKDERG